MTNPINADQPLTESSADRYGYAPFAQNLADTIISYPGPDALVLALHGPWGSGKSTVLNFIRKELKKRENSPTQIDFNPWWFSGQEDLAKAFLSQFQAALDNEGGFENIRTSLAKYSGALGQFAGLLGKIPGLESVGGIAEVLIKALADQKPQDVSALKKEVCDELRKKKQKILIVIDDIDRLTPEEIRQLFTVIKALADFPYVIYLLAFDRQVAVNAIKAQMGLPGERFLEKIIQVPFELPLLDRVKLHESLRDEVASLSKRSPSGSFDEAYFEHVFNAGIKDLISVPRQVVRLRNTLLVTYPPVWDHVHAVDFFAIEALRIFQPTVYDVIRQSPRYFLREALNHAGKDSDSDRDQKLKFHEGWLKERVPKSSREAVKKIVCAIFPQVERVFNRHIYDSSPMDKALRISASQESFDIYFRLHKPEARISHSMLKSLRDKAGDPLALEGLLLHYAELDKSDRSRGVEHLLEGLQGLLKRGIDSDQAKGFLTTFLNIDDLFWPDFQSVISTAGLCCIVLETIEEEKDRYQVLSQGMSTGGAILVPLILLAQYGNGSLSSPDGNELVGKSMVPDLKRLWVERVSKKDLTDYPEEIKKLIKVTRENFEKAMESTQNPEGVNDAALPEGLQEVR